MTDAHEFCRGRDESFFLKLGYDMNGDTLGVILSFLAPSEILGRYLFTVSKEWFDVLCHRPHSWTHHLDLACFNTAGSPNFAWKHVTSLSIRLDLLTPSFTQCFTRLTYLDLSSTDCSQGLRHLSSLSLGHLNLDGVWKTTDEELLYLSHMPLRALILSGCEQITDVGLANISMLPLRELNLYNCWRITDAGLAHLSKMPLENLDLSNVGITDSGLAHLSSVTSLTRLELWGCYKISDVGMSHLSSMRLWYLSIAFCTLISDAGLVHLSLMPLTFLRAGGCRMTHEALERFRQNATVNESLVPNRFL